MKKNKLNSKSIGSNTKSIRSLPSPRSSVAASSRPISKPNKTTNESDGKAPQSKLLKRNSSKSMSKEGGAEERAVPLGMSLDGEKVNVSQKDTVKKTVHPARKTALNNRRSKPPNNPLSTKVNDLKLSTEEFAPPKAPPVSTLAPEDTSAEETFSAATGAEEGEDISVASVSASVDNELSSSRVVPSAPPLVGKLPLKANWPNAPILIRWSSGAGPVELSYNSQPIHRLDALPANSSPISFESALFKGQVMLRMAKVQADPTGDSAEYFDTRRRTLQICIVGKFKRRICFDNVYSGQEFARPLRRVPPKRLVRWAFSLLRSRLPEAFVADLFGPLPYFLAPLVLAAKVVRADSDESCPDIMEHDIMEDLTAHGVMTVKLDPVLIQEAKPSNGARSQKKHDSKVRKARQKAAADAVKQRKRSLGQPSLLSKQFYETDKTYTFDYYDSFFRPDSFCLDLGVKKLDVCPIVGEQPLCSSMAKTLDTGEYLWKFEIWHQRSLSDSSDLFNRPENETVE